VSLDLRSTAGEDARCAARALRLASVRSPVQIRAPRLRNSPANAGLWRLLGAARHTNLTPFPPLSSAPRSLGTRLLGESKPGDWGFLNTDMEA
jgi:hypothetical protein